MKLKHATPWSASSSLSSHTHTHTHTHNTHTHTHTHTPWYWYACLVCELPIRYLCSSADIGPMGVSRGQRSDALGGFVHACTVCTSIQVCVRTRPRGLHVVPSLFTRTNSSAVAISCNAKLSPTGQTAWNPVERALYNMH